MFLLDTNVVSELRRVRPHGGVVAWLGQVPDDQLYLSAVTLGELQAGVERLRGQEPERAAGLEIWIDQVERSWNLLPVTPQIFRLWARMVHGKPDRLLEDALIAATAIAHDLTVTTRNTRDFDALGVATLNPFTISR